MGAAKRQGAAGGKRNAGAPPPGPARHVAPLEVASYPVVRALRRVGVILLILAACSSGFLAYQHLGGRIPGCGPGAGCARLQHSEYGRIPGIGWPIAFVGTAYFSALALGFGTETSWRRSILRIIAWLGAAASVGFLVLMASLGEWCQYCAAAHALNLLFFGFMEASIRIERKRAGTEGASVMRSSRMRGIGAFAGVFVLCSAGLGIADSVRAAERAEAAEAEREASAARIIERSKIPASEQPVDRWGAAGFTGRYRRGPEQAALRIVVLTDYQCPDCRRVEGEIEAVLKERTDTSLSVKHFPMCLDCNKYAGRTMHANACWAARAAEAAGFLGGDEAFFKMHDWLFENRGQFITAEDLAPGIAAAGLDAASFHSTFKAAQLLKNIQTDVEDGMALGLYSTPMIFINGVEFKGWHVPGAFRRTVEQVAATNPPARTAAADRPVLAAQRYVDDWKEAIGVAIPADTTAWTRGLKPGENPPDGARPVEIVVFGDYQEENTIKLNAQILEAMKGRSDVRYTFRHYPVDPACNTVLPAGVPAASIHPLACKAATAAEAAGALGGNDAYWKMHQWLMDNWKSVSDERIAAAAKEFGWDEELFAAALKAPGVAAAIAEDCRGAKGVGLTRIPYVFVNNRVVPRVLREGDNVIRRIIEEASKK